MTINYTNLLGLAKPVTGTETGQWGDVVNDQITELIEDAVANASSISVTSGDVTLTTTTGSSNQARMAVLLITGSPGVSRNIIAPSQSKWYIVKNSSNASIVVKGSATTGVTILADTEALVFWNGSDFEVAGLVGPSSSTDNAVARFDSTTGKVIQNSGVTIDDSNNVSGVAQLNATTADLTNLEVTNIKAKDGTAAASIADSTGVISITSNPILSGGTANGVLYLNGSKAATSGSALTFDGTNFATTGTASATKLIPTGGAITGNGMYLPAANSVAITTNGAQAIYIDSSQNVGIGTSSPDVRLVAAGTIKSSIDGTANNKFFSLVDTASGGKEWALYNRNGGTAGLFAIRNVTDNITALNINSSGNLGLGITPSAWGSGSAAFEFGSTNPAYIGFNSSGAGGGYIYSNAYYNGTNNIYKFTGVANAFGVGPSGGFQFFTAASGTAGNTISFTQAMTLDSSGNLVVGGTTATNTAANRGNISINGTSNAILSLSTGNTARGYVYHSGSDMIINATTGTLALQANGNGALIDTSGNLGIGTTSPSVASGKGIAINGGAGQARVAIKNNTSGDASTDGFQLVLDTSNIAYVEQRENADLVFSTNAAERARITSGGYFKASNNGSYAGSTGNYYEFRSSEAALSCVRIDSTSASLTTHIVENITATTAGTGWWFQRMYSGNAADLEFALRGDGNGYADGTWNNNGADYAEYFESANGQALTLGATVVLDGNKVREATDQDPVSAIMGVVRPKEPSKASMVVGNTAWNKWANKYLTDDFDRYIMEDHDVVEWIDEEGKQHSYESHKIPTGVTVPVDAVVKTHDDKGKKFQHYKLNPAWNPDAEYVNRENRPEWIIVGLVGQVKVLKGQPVNDRWIKMRDVSATVEEWMIR